MSKDFTLDNMTKTGLTSLINTSNIVNASNHTRCVSLGNRKCEIQPTLINLHRNEYSEKLHYY